MAEGVGGIGIVCHILLCTQIVVSTLPDDLFAHKTLRRFELHVMDNGLSVYFICKYLKIRFSVKTNLLNAH